jgi:hypothetical protein
MSKTVVYRNGELFGFEVDPRSLTKHQLIKAIENYGRCVVKRPDDTYNMFDPECKMEYETFEWNDDESLMVVNPDGSGTLFLPKQKTAPAGSGKNEGV